MTPIPPNPNPGETPPQFLATPEGFGRGAAGVPGVAGAPGSPGAGVGGVILGYVRTLPLPQLVKPPVGRDFNPNGQVTGVNLAAGTTEVFSYKPPLGTVAYIRSVLFHAQNIVPTTDMVWGIRVDGTPAPGFGAVPVLPGNIPVWELPYGPDEMYLTVEGGKTISVVVTVSDAGAYDVGSLMHGWIVPTSVAQAADAAWNL